MNEKKPGPTESPAEDLGRRAAEKRQQRAAKSRINADVATPVNAAAPLNVLSDESEADAEDLRGREDDDGLAPEEAIALTPPD